ncbi:MAG: hypothetical protein KF690_03135 [Bacteroidetes bacterium]|nr:hypothetical protein [Bacteroidota bacterium]
MGLFSFGKKSVPAGTKTLVVLDWDRISGMLTDLSFLKDKKNPVLHIYSRKPAGVLLQDLQKKYPTKVHTVPGDERNFSNYMSCSIIYEYARNAEFSSILFVFEGKGLGSTQRFLESEGIKVENVSLGGGEDRKPRRERGGDRPERNAERGDRRDNRTEARAPRQQQPQQENRNAQGQRENRGEGRKEENRKDRNQRGDRNRDRKPRYEATGEDATRMAGRFRELFNLFKDYPQEQLVILVKQSTEQDMQAIFGSRNPRIMVEALVHAGLATVPVEGKISLTDFPSETFCRQLLRVNGERLPRPERKPATQDAPAPAAQEEGHEEDYPAELPQTAQVND